jgi:hypothetical protein
MQEREQEECVRKKERKLRNDVVAARFRREGGSLVSISPLSLSLSSRALLIHGRSPTMAG